LRNGKFALALREGLNHSQSPRQRSHKVGIATVGVNLRRNRQRGGRWRVRTRCARNLSIRIGASRPQSARARSASNLLSGTRTRQASNHWRLSGEQSSNNIGERDYTNLTDMHTIFRYSA
jgi:hypothetical protein